MKSGVWGRKKNATHAPQRSVRGDKIPATTQFLVITLTKERERADNALLKNCPATKCASYFVNQRK